MNEQLITTDGEVTGLEIKGDAFVAPVTKEEIEERQRKLKSLDDIDVNTGTSIVSSYWEARQGDEIRGIFMGWKILEKKDPNEAEGVKKIPAVVIETKEGQRIIGAMQVVDSFYGKVPDGAAVWVKCTKAKTGEMKEFEIKVIG
jgi:hypothetical protein